ncbi:hypothetical protein QCA50_002124 [Cerrena zonata]|uniref:Uncharacterized protein n=1 Tax=Cerrena zonata TaxID=2478898 RepID=A0AAW0GYI6_9APHY
MSRVQMVLSALEVFNGAPDKPPWIPQTPGSKISSTPLRHGPIVMFCCSLQIRHSARKSLQPKRSAQKLLMIFTKSMWPIGFLYAIHW